MRIPTRGQIEISALTASLKQVVPAVNGCEEFPGFVEIRPLPGQTFSAADEGLLRALVDAHDGEAIRQTRRARELAQEQARESPVPTTLADRVTRLERILGVA